jgi:hypothetical protein
MRIQIALTDATSATAGLRSVSVAVSSSACSQSGAIDGHRSYAFVGSAQAEAQITDAVTGERLAASVDQRES